MLGDAAIPVNMLILGASLQKGPEWGSIHRQTLLGVVLCKLLLMPIIALAAVAALVMPGGVQVPSMLLMVILMESAMPTANNMLIMCELAGGHATKTVSTTIFVQYCATPVLLTFTLSSFMLFVRLNSQ